MIEISTSILNVEKENLIKTIYDLETALTDYFHIDVMDGKFVPKNTTNQMKEYAETIKQISNIPLDVHLMVENIKEHIDEYLPLTPRIITFHLEACRGTCPQVPGLPKGVTPTINYIKSNGCKIGISIKPNTQVEEIYEYLPNIHMVLIMTVEPGLGGQKLIPETIEKVKKLKQYIDKNNLEVDIEVDGGINLDNVELLKEAGANILVSGTAIINAENIKETIKKMQE